MGLCRRDRNDRGYTLIEVIACLGLITVGLVTALTIRNNNIQQSGAVANLNRGTAYAAANIEELVIDYQQNGYLTEPSGYFDDERQYRWRASVRDVVLKDIGLMAELKFTFRYPTPDGEGSFEVTRIVEKPDVR